MLRLLRRWRDLVVAHVLPGMAAAAVVAHVGDELFAALDAHRDVLVAEAAERGVLARPEVGVVGIDFHQPAVLLADLAELRAARDDDTRGRARHRRIGQVAELGAVRLHLLVHPHVERVGSGRAALEVLLRAHDRAPRRGRPGAVERRADDPVAEPVGVHSLEHVGRGRAGADQVVEVTLLVRRGPPRRDALVGDAVEAQVSGRPQRVDREARQPVDAAVLVSGS